MTAPHAQKHGVTFPGVSNNFCNAPGAIRRA